MSHGAARPIQGRVWPLGRPGEDKLRIKIQEELERAAGEGHFGNEGWHLRKDGSRFWANVITKALKDENGALSAR
jgi:hypothetical protein